MLNKNKTPIVDKLIDYYHENRISFHVPGHKGHINYTFNEKFAGINNFLKLDITEIPGMDDFHEASGIIREGRKLAAELFGADDSYFLVNGTSSGIMAAVAAAAYEGEKILVAENCHLSVIKGLIISGAVPIYIKLNYDKENFIYGSISLEALEKVFLENDNIKALVLTNPSYNGTYSDLKAICDFVHAKGALVIVDEAHGAQLRFLPDVKIPDAMSVGADISVQSTHKMLGSLTQSSMLHIKGNRVDKNRLNFFINMLTSTSPSYLLMASLDLIRGEMAINGIKNWKKIVDNTKKAIEYISNLKGINCLREFHDGDTLRKIEPSRIVFSGTDLGFTGHKLSEELLKNYKIDVEFSDDIYVVALSGYGTRKKDLNILCDALSDISLRFNNLFMSSINNKRKQVINYEKFNHDIVTTPREAAMSFQKFTKVEQLKGKIAAEIVAVYPPGIPLLLPGERISSLKGCLIKELLDMELHIHGIRSEIIDGNLEKGIFTINDDIILE